MNIDELQEKKRQLEQDIHGSIAKYLAEFKKDTGMSTDSVSIYTDKLQAIGAESHELVVTKVSCDIYI